MPRCREPRGEVNQLPAVQVWRGGRCGRREAGQQVRRHAFARIAEAARERRERVRGQACQHRNAAGCNATA
eukprot:119667-Chlamydomonas_euryale.AAC.3